MRQNNPKLEAVIKDFMDKKIGLLIPNTYIELKKTPGIFFLVAYGAVCMPNLKYSEELQRYFEQRDIEQLSTFQFINTLLKSEKAESLHNLEKFSTLSKMYGFKYGSEEELSFIKRMRQTAIPQYFSMIKKLDISEKYFNGLKKKGYIRDDELLKSSIVISM